MKSISEPPMSQIAADWRIADCCIPNKNLSSNHLRPSAPSVVNLLQSGGEE